jgi:hypothetical protein
MLLIIKDNTKYFTRLFLNPTKNTLLKTTIFETQLLKNIALINSKPLY